MCKNKVEGKCCGNECASKKEAKQKEVAIKFNMERMQKDLKGESLIMFPESSIQEKDQLNF